MTKKELMIIKEFIDAMVDAHISKCYDVDDNFLGYEIPLWAIDKLKDRIAKLAEEEEKPWPFISPTDIKVMPNTNKTNPCLDCDFYKKTLEKPYIGDAPCEWCPHNPFKLTFTSNTENK